MRITLPNGTTITPYKMKYSNSYFLKCGKYYIVDFNISLRYADVDTKLRNFDFTKNDIELLKFDEYKYIQHIHSIGENTQLYISVPSQIDNDRSLGCYRYFINKQSKKPRIPEYGYEIYCAREETNIQKSNVVSVFDARQPHDHSPFYVSSGLGKTILLLNIQLIYLCQFIWLRVSNSKDNNSIVSYENYIPTALLLAIAGIDNNGE